jgi:cytochrome c5
MLKKTLVPLLLVSLMAACSKKEEAPAPAPAPAPAVAPSTAPAPAPEPAPAPAPAAAASSSAATSGAATTTAAAGGGDTAQGEKVFKGTCAMCHQTGAGGAPVVGNKGDWAPRIAQGKDTLYTHAINGFTGQKGTMPPKGANASLPDADVKAAVDYMVSKAQ